MYIGVNPTNEYLGLCHRIRFHFAGPAFALAEPGAVVVACAVLVSLRELSESPLH